MDYDHEFEEWGGGVVLGFAKLDKDLIGIINSFGYTHIPNPVAAIVLTNPVASHSSHQPCSQP